MASGVRLALSLTSTAGRPAGLFLGVAAGILVYALALVTILRPEFMQLVELAKGTLRFPVSDSRRAA
jgi:hypothetical protein